MKNVFYLSLIFWLLTGCNSQTGELDGIFSVSDTLKIKFSKGNLQYNPKDGTFKFADNQWDLLTVNNNKLSEKPFDLFAWGENWGENSDWRTMTSMEWDYLFFKRSGALKLFSYAEVCGVKGLVLLPDNFQQPAEIVFKIFNADELSVFNRGVMFKNSAADIFKKNVYSDKEWEKMQNSGAVFLPLSGKVFEGFNYSQEEGAYWTPSPEGLYVAINRKYLSAVWGCQKEHFRYAVRLVKNVK